MKKLRFRRLCIVLTVAILVALLGGKVLSVQKNSDDPVKSFVLHCSFFSPVKYKNLTVIPLRAPSGDTKGEIYTLDEAMSQGVLSVREVSSSGSVNQLAVTNSGKRPVFIMAGEIMRGSKQDRVLKDDVIIPSNSGKIIVDVYCVEQGRWTYKSDQFYSEKQTANISVRQRAKETKSQSAVWDSVATTNQRFEQAPAGSLAKTFESEEVKKNKDAYLTPIADIPSQYPEANGVVVLINGRVLAADIFSDRHIFKGLWSKLADSYAVEAISLKEREAPSDISSASDFLKKVQSSNISYRESSGSGKNIEITSSEITGSGILFGNMPLHLDIFPKTKLSEPTPLKRGLHRNYDHRQQVLPLE